jgi:hypothetical protein
MKAVQKDREEKLAETLKNKLHLYVQGHKEEFIRYAEAEVAKLSNAGSNLPSHCLIEFNYLFLSKK